MSASLLADQLPIPFSYRLLRLKTRPINMSDWFLCYFLWLKESNVLPGLSSPRYSGKPGSTAVVRTFCAPAARIRPICAALRENARVEIC